jgi:cytochrome c
MYSPSRNAGRALPGEGTCHGSGIAAVFALCLLGACGGGKESDAVALTGGNPERGKDAIRAYGCPSCHTIPGVFGADGLVGPPLGGIAKRVAIAGILPNTPENMIRWLQNPPAVNPQTLMPNMNVPESDARDIASYLYTLLD